MSKENAAQRLSRRLKEPSPVKGGSIIGPSSPPRNSTVNTASAVIVVIAWLVAQQSSAASPKKIVLMTDPPSRRLSSTVTSVAACSYSVYAHFAPSRLRRARGGYSRRCWPFLWPCVQTVSGFAEH